jgi:outer membrane protein assembly factor BamC
MKVLQIGISSAVLVSLVSCSVLGAGGKRIDYGAAAVKVPSLEVPPDLTTPGGEERYKMPQGEGEAPVLSPSTSSGQAPLSGAEGVATYSDYNKGGVQGRAASAVLPEVQGVHMERNNAQRWLVISDKAENVWPVVKVFWQEIGLTVSSEDQAAGVMETGWAENRARIPQGGSHTGFNQEFSNAHSAGERDQYRTRLERSKDGVSTEVYITHRGIKEEFSATKGTSRWVARANDPELEAIVLQRLMVRFGVGEAKAASAVAAVSPAAAASAVAAASAATLNAPEPVGMASLREVSGGSTIIVVNDAFDRSWRKVGLAIESAGLAVEDKNRDKGTYFLRPVKLESGWLDKLKFWKSNVDTTRRYRVNVKDGGTSCEVSIVDQDGASNKVTKQMLEAIYKNINQQ